MRNILSCVVLLAVFFVAEPAPQRGPPEGGLLPIPIGSILSQLQELRNNARQRPGEILGVFLNPRGSVKNPRPWHRRPGNKHKAEDHEAEAEDAPEDTPQPEKKRPGNKNKVGDKDHEAHAEDAPEDTPQPEKKRPGGNKNQGKQGNSTKKDQEGTQPPQSSTTKNEEDSPQPSSPSNSEPENVEIEKFIRPPPSAGPPPPSPSPADVSTEDWSKVSPATSSGVDQVTRKILSAPCLGGLSRDGTCKVSFDDE